MRRFLVWMAAGVLAGAAAPAGLAAQGYGIYEHGTCMMGRAGTGTASPCADGSAIFFNPAGIVGSGRGTLGAGVTYIGPTGSFTDDASIAEGATFETVLDELRHKMALHYLDSKKVSVNETAYLVGFSEAAAFSRAFKRWTGTSPRKRV